MFAHETSIYFCIHQVQNNSTRIVTQEAISIKFAFAAIPSVKCKKVQQKLVINSADECVVFTIYTPTSTGKRSQFTMTLHTVTLKPNSSITSSWHFIQQHGKECMCNTLCPPPRKKRDYIL